MNNKAIHVKFVVSKVAMDGLDSEHFSFTLSMIVPPVLNVRLSTKRGIVSGPIGGAVRQRYSLSAPQ